MFAVKKILTAFIVPPGTFILLSFAAFFWLRRKGKKDAARVFLLFASVLWIFSVKPVSDAFIRPLEYAYARGNAENSDAIVVLGGGITENAPDLASAHALKGDAMARVVEAFRLHRRYGYPVITTGGRVFSRAAEAEVAGKILEDMGVEKEKIFMETESRDTFENALYCADICRREGFDKIILVTSAFHIPRALEAFGKAGFEGVVPFGTNYRSSVEGEYGFYDWLPGPMEDLSAAVKEYAGLIFYKIYY